MRNWDPSLPVSNARGSAATYIGAVLWLILLIGLLNGAAQYLLTRAYAVTDATYLQPLDDLKLPLNVLASWVILAQVPNVCFWPGPC